MSIYDCKKFERKLALNSAPTLLGVKAANLISLNQDMNVIEYAEFFNARIAPKGIKIRFLCNVGGRNLVLVYNEKLLSSKLCECRRKEFLCSCGYDKCDCVESCLEKLADRIKKNSDFPHEIGVFLDYPMEDVLGFIENKGKDFKLCGYWKVYGDEEKARRIFRSYNRCRDYLCDKLDKCADIYQALKVS